MGKRREGPRKLAYNIIDEAVARWFQVMLLREFTDLAVNNCDAERRGLQGETFDELLQIRGQTAAFAPIGTPLP